MSNLFKQVNWEVSALLAGIDMGSIGLPDIQRPFVWPDSKVRDLFDSMYQGFPVGYLLFWENAYGDSKTIGHDRKQLPAKLLIVDGQQRLTSLYAVMKEVPVLREDYTRELIQIAFNPQREQFKVADAAIRRDPAFIPDVSLIWKTPGAVFEVVTRYLEAVDPSNQLGAEERQRVQQAILKLSNLSGFPFTVLQLSSQLEAEQVAEVFVRINSKGTPLNQADFILTLMSVFWDEGRSQLEAFCRSAKTPSEGETSPFNYFIRPGPDQMLRVGVGLAFKRARLRSVYSLLRGRDLDTGQFKSERRDQQFEVLREAQARVLNLNYWHDFLKALQVAGYRGGRMITSDNNILYTYVLYMIGRTEIRVDEHRLRRVTARWFFMASLTGRYTKSPESDFEFDLARFRAVQSADDFVGILDSICDDTLTPDFWSIALPNALATSASRSPSLFAYYASLVLLDAKALFSKNSVQDLLDPWVRAPRMAAERHHLFPKAYLEREGVRDQREINQIANYALTDWKDNSVIRDRAPSEYLPELIDRVDHEELARMYRWHALPLDWEVMAYPTFLENRRELMARVIKDGFERLSPHHPQKAKPRPIAQMVDEGESANVEFKSTLRINLHTHQPDAKMELAALKTIAGFLNAAGGTLVVGVQDEGTPIGIEVDGFPNEDKYSLHLVNLIKSRIGSTEMMYIHPRFENHHGFRVLVVECWPSQSPVYVKEGQQARFFVRTGPSTPELNTKEAQEYIRERFRA